jgi:hypothetical protein
MRQWNQPANLKRIAHLNPYPLVSIAERHRNVKAMGPALNINGTLETLDVERLKSLSEPTTDDVYETALIKSKSCWKLIIHKAADGASNTQFASHQHLQLDDDDTVALYFEGPDAILSMSQ